MNDHTADQELLFENEQKSDKLTKDVKPVVPLKIGQMF